VSPARDSGRCSAMQNYVEHLKYNKHIAGILERLRREPALRALVLTAPTRALAALGVSLDDEQLVELLEQIEAMEQRPRALTAHDVMTTNVLTIAPESSAHAAAHVLAKKRIGELPVIGPDGVIAGMLSVYDLLTKSGDTVGEIMSREVTTVLETVPIGYVRTVLISHHVDRVPVTDVAVAWWASSLLVTSCANSRSAGLHKFGRH
jgi:CBS-domain-containing membrane protein